MSGLTAVLLATPMFGFSLTPPALDDVAPQPIAISAHTPFAKLSPTWLLENDDETDEGGGAALGGGASADASGDSSGGGEQQLSDDEYARQLRERADLTKIHRPLGIATWAAMGITLFLGGVQYHNLYGEFAGRGDNPCVQGDAIFGQSQCTGTPWLHLTAAMVTTGLYTRRSSSA